MGWIIGLVTTLVTSTAIRAVVVRIAVALGISVVTHAAIGITFDTIFATASASLAGSGAATLQFLQLLKIPNALNVIASSYASALALKGLTGAGVLKKISWGGTGSVIGS